MLLRELAVSLGLREGTANGNTALQSHWTADMLMAPSKVPGRKGSPSPRSCRHKSPSLSRSCAISSIAGLISRPYIAHSSHLQTLRPNSAQETVSALLTVHICPCSDSASPDRPEPQPRSNSIRGTPSSGKANSSRARSVSVACDQRMRCKQQH